MRLPIVRIKTDSDLGWVEINEKDFDEKKHELYKEEVKKELKKKVKKKYKKKEK